MRLHQAEYTLNYMVNFILLRSMQLKMFKGTPTHPAKVATIIFHYFFRKFVQSL